MVYIALSVIQSTLIFIFFKLFDRLKVDNWQAILTNYFVAAIFCFFLGDVSKEPDLFIHEHWVPYAFLLGAMFIATFFFFALSSQKAGVAITSVISKMSVIIPVLFGAYLYKEAIGVVKITGIVVALVAFYLVFKKDKKPLLQRQWLFLPVMVFLGNGFVDTGMKYMQHHFIGQDIIPFLMFTFATSMVIALIINVIRTLSGKTFIQWRGIAGGTLLGLVNVGSTYYIIKALGVYESSIVFPVANSAIVGLSALTGYFGFKEKLSLLNWSGIILAIAAIIIIANA